AFQVHAYSAVALRDRADDGAGQFRRIIIGLLARVPLAALAAHLALQVLALESLAVRPEPRHAVLDPIVHEGHVDTAVRADAKPLFAIANAVASVDVLAEHVAAGRERRGLKVACVAFQRAAETFACADVKQA